MYRFTKKGVAINQATGIWLVFGIFLDDFALENAEENLIKREIVCLGFFVCVIGDSYSISTYSLDQSSQEALQFIVMNVSFRELK